MKKILQLSGFVGGLLAPFSFVFAQNSNPINNILITAIDIVQTILQLLIVVAIAYFIYGIVKYVIAKGAEDKEEGKKHLTNGLIGLFVIVSFWGIISLVTGTFGVFNQPGGAIDNLGVPCVAGVNC